MSSSMQGHDDKSHSPALPFVWVVQVVLLSTQTHSRSLIDDQVYDEFAYHQFLLCVYLDPFILMVTTCTQVHLLLQFNNLPLILYCYYALDDMHWQILIMHIFFLVFTN